MNELDRRDFLKRSTQTGVGLGATGMALAQVQPARAASANEKLVLGVVGIRGRGAHLAKGFAERSDCEVAYVADVDSTLFASRIPEITETQGKEPKTVQDLRKVLDDKSVDAIVVATPDHWHALATVWGCQAGKHVYVEKPISHSPWEGRQMVNAARKHNRVVQVGTQNRSAEYNRAAKEYLDSGKLGTIHMCRVYNQKQWGNRPAIPDSPTPKGVDYDMWTGPAELRPFNQNRFHSRWHHFWEFSGGDIINDGVHQMDLARWLIGRDYPKSVYSVGGRWAEEGGFETPDTQMSVFEYDGLTMTFELTLYTPYMLKTDPVVRNTDMFPLWPQNATRIEIYGTQGMMVVGRHGGGWQVFARPHQRQPVVAAQHYGRFPDVDHKQNFVDAIRGDAQPNADILEGHRSTLLCQYANISYRLGGEKLIIDPKTERCAGNERANALLKREYREPYVVPEIAAS